MKIRPLATQLVHTYRWTDGRTDMTKLTVAFRNSANARKRRHLQLQFIVDISNFNAYISKEI
jgi:hypothetical protein